MLNRTLPRTRIASTIATVGLVLLVLRPWDAPWVDPVIYAAIISPIAAIPIAVYEMCRLLVGRWFDGERAGKLQIVLAIVVLVGVLTLFDSIAELGYASIILVSYVLIHELATGVLGTRGRTRWSNTDSGS